MIRAVRVFRAFQLWNEADSIDYMIARVFRPSSVENGGVNIHHRSDLLVMHCVLRD